MRSFVVTSITDMLSEIAELQRGYVAETCPACSDPCCNKVRFLFCEKDILFFRLSGQHQKWRRETFNSRGCRFLGPAGCILDSTFRPFVCHRYICSDLEKKMNSDRPGLVASLRKKIKSVDDMRSRLWAVYLEERMNGRESISFR